MSETTKRMKNGVEKNRLTELVMILDRSGSMAGLESDTIGGFNGMIRSQKKEDGEVLVTTVLFDSELKRLHDRVPISSIPEMTEKDYRVGGCTALLDAIGETVDHISSIHRYIRPEDVPAKTLFVITTDGMENASRSYSADQIKKTVERKQKEGWEFLFLGANMDAITTARSFGIREDHAATYMCDSAGTMMNFVAVGKAMSQVRHGKAVSKEWKKEIEQREAESGSKKR